MDSSSDDLMALRFGANSVADNIAAAVAQGRLKAGPDDTFYLPPKGVHWGKNWARVSKQPPLGCRFLMSGIHLAAYAGTAVPFGCRNCYKVKAEFATLLQLVAAWGIAKQHQFTSKWGIDHDNAYSQAVYAGYYYVPSLEVARAHYWRLRQEYADQPKLGDAVVITIKRGCSEYEEKLGPSDSYSFTADQAALEAHLKTRIRESPDQARSGPSPLPLAHWIDFAFRSGDDSYLAFTGGKRLRTKSLSYDPGAPPV